MKMFTLLIDPGHGGPDQGATYTHDGMLYVESLLNLAIAKKVHARLADDNYVMITRRHDVQVYLSDRLQISKLLKPDAFVSIHCNAGPEGATGTETLYRDDGDIPLASAIQGAVVEDLGLRNRGVRSDVLYLKKELTVLSDLEIPSCLVEMGFLTNKEDMDTLADTDKAASAIARGMRAWWAEEEKK